MKRAPLILSILAVALLLAAQALAAQVIFADKFTAMDPAWGTPDDVISVKDGKFIIAPPPGRWRVVLNQANFLPNDMVASVTLTYQKAGDPEYGSGLVFWAKDFSDFYVLSLSPQGWFAVQRYAGDRWLLPVPWRQMDGVKAGENVPIILRVVAKDNKATAFVNDKEVVTFAGQPPQGGGLIGLKGSSGPKGVNAAAFSDLQVTAP